MAPFIDLGGCFPPRDFHYRAHPDTQAKTGDLARLPGYRYTTGRCSFDDQIGGSPGVGENIDDFPALCFKISISRRRFYNQLARVPAQFIDTA